MSFDSGLLCCALKEIRDTATGMRVERVCQPQNDEIDLQMRGRDGNCRILFRCGSADTRVQLTSRKTDNPQVPPTFCMLLRKHLQGAVLSGVFQEGFERVCRVEFDSRDELGYDCKRILEAEIMGRNSNLMLTDGSGKILAVMRPVDFTVSRLRQVLPGMKYELPPAQEGKLDPRGITIEAFSSLAASAAPGGSAASFLNKSFLGISPAVAREAVYRACGDTGASLAATDCRTLFRTFSEILKALEDASAAPCLVTDGGRPVEFSYIPLTQYGSERLTFPEGFGALLDRYYGERDRSSMVSSRAADLQKAVNTAISRLERKIAVQSRELADCDREDEYRADADLIVSNLYLLKRGDSSARLTDYTQYNGDGSFAVRTVSLDPLLTPSANAQRLYKKYAKCRTARAELTKQIKLASGEADYLRTVRDALSRAETGAELAGIRNELEKTGYIKVRRNAAPSKSVKSSPALYRTSGGFDVLCGRNNLQNDELTLKTAEKTDIWFHVKGLPGSHVILRTGGISMDDMPAQDMTEAAEIAAQNSDAAGGSQIAVDYTEVKNIRKPAGSRPGFVTYKTNSTAYVTPDRDRVAERRR